MKKMRNAMQKPLLHMHPMMKCLIPKNLAHSYRMTRFLVMILVKESFMNVLSALILSEEFQGIVSSEAGRKLYEDESSMSPVPSKTGENSKSQQEDSGNGGISGLEVKNANSDRSSADDGGLALLWFGVITSLLVLFSINMASSSFFNP